MENNEDPSYPSLAPPKKRQAGRRPQINIVQHIHSQKENTDATTSFSIDFVKDDHYGIPVFREKNPLSQQDPNTAYSEGCKPYPLHIKKNKTKQADIFT